MQTDHSNGGAVRHFGMAFWITLLTAAAVAGILLALVRMEGTVSREPFTLFSLRFGEAEGPRQLDLTLLEQDYHLDLSGAEKAYGKLEQAAAYAPAEWQILSTMIEEAVEQISIWVETLL